MFFFYREMSRFLRKFQHVTDYYITIKQENFHVLEKFQFQ